jgi:hypothetical protein
VRRFLGAELLRPFVPRARHRNVSRNSIDFELAQGVIVGELLGEWDREEMQAGILRDVGEERDRLADHAHERRHLARPQLLQSAGLIDVDLFDLDPEALEDDRPAIVPPRKRRENNRCPRA